MRRQRPLAYRGCATPFRGGYVDRAAVEQEAFERAGSARGSRRSRRSWRPRFDAATTEYAAGRVAEIRARRSRRPRGVVDP
jgi:hypothetical protein